MYRFQKTWAWPYSSHSWWTLDVHLEIFVLGKLRGSSLDIFTKGTFLSEVSFMEKSYRVGGGWWPIGL